MSQVFFSWCWVFAEFKNRNWKYSGFFRCRTVRTPILPIGYWWRGDMRMLMLVDSCVLRERSVTCWKTSTSVAAFRALRASAVRAVRAVGAYSGRTVPLCPSTAPSPRRSLRPVDTHSAPTLTARTWTWDWPTRGAPAPKVDPMRTSARQLTRQTCRSWRRLQQQLNSPSSRVCQWRSQWSVQTIWARMTVTSIYDIIQYRQRSDGF